MSKKTAPKKRAKKPDPKAAGERALNQRNIAMEEEALRIRRIVSKMLEPVQERLTALEARSAPAEEPLRVGDYVYLTREHTFDAFHDTIVRVKRVYPDGDPGFDHPASATGGDATAGMWRRATPAEIASHKAKEEQRALEAEWAKELAKPLEFGTKVRPNNQVVTGQPTDLVWRVACPAMNRHEQYCLVALGEEEVFPVYIHLKRHEFQIID